MYWVRGNERQHLVKTKIAKSHRDHQKPLTGPIVDVVEWGPGDLNPILSFNILFFIEYQWATAYRWINFHLAHNSMFSRCFSLKSYWNSGYFCQAKSQQNPLNFIDEHFIMKYNWYKMTRFCDFADALIWNFIGSYRKSNWEIENIFGIFWSLEAMSQFFSVSFLLYLALSLIHFQFFNESLKEILFTSIIRFDGLILKSLKQILCSTPCCKDANWYHPIHWQLSKQKSFDNRKPVSHPFLGILINAHKTVSWINEASSGYLALHREPLN